MISDDLGNLGDGHEGAYVRLPYNALELVYLNSRYDTVQHGLTAAGNEPLGGNEGAGPAELLINAVGKLLRVFGYYEHRLCLLHALLHDVDYLERYEIGQKRKHGPVPAEQNARRDVDKNIYHEDYLTRGHARVL